MANRGEFGGGPAWETLPPPPQQLPPSLLQMAQGVVPQMSGDAMRGQFGGGPDIGVGGSVDARPAAFGDWQLPTNDTPEGEQAAQEYVKHLQYIKQLREGSNNPRFELDRNRQDTLAKAGARYTIDNKISYEPPPEARPDVGGGFYMPGEGRGRQQQAEAGGSGFYMGGKPMAVPGVQGDAGQQLNRLPAFLRDAYGPAVVQHIMGAHGSGLGGVGAGFPGSLAYMLSVPTFEAGDSFRLNRDAWGRGFGLGSSDVMWPQRPNPATST